MSRKRPKWRAGREATPSGSVEHTRVALANSATQPLEGQGLATPKNKSVLKAFAMLQAFDGPDEYLTSAELSRRAGLPEASGYRLIQTLEAAGAVMRDSRGLYHPGFLLAAVTRKVSFTEMIGEAASDVLDDLAERFEATAHLGILEQGMVTYVGKASATTSVAVPTKVGAQQEAYCSAIGKVLLAALTHRELESFLKEGELVALTERTITDPAVFRREIAQVRRDGFALDTGEAHAHLCCVAAPVIGEAGATVAALSIVQRIDKMEPARHAPARAALSVAAGAIGRRLRTLAAGGPVGPRVSNWSLVGGAGLAGR